MSRLGPLPVMSLALAGVLFLLTAVQPCKETPDGNPSFLVG